MNRGIVPSLGSRRGLLPALVICVLLGASLAATGSALWDLRGRSLTLAQARAAAASGNERDAVAAVVTLLRESRQSIDLLQTLSHHPNPRISEQATLALGHLRAQVR